MWLSTRRRLMIGRLMSDGLMIVIIFLMLALPWTACALRLHHTWSNELHILNGELNPHLADRSQFIQGLHGMSIDTDIYNGRSYHSRGAQFWLAEFLFPFPRPGTNIITFAWFLKCTGDSGNRRHSTLCNKLVKELLVTSCTLFSPEVQRLSSRKLNKLSAPFGQTHKRHTIDILCVQNPFGLSNL